MKKFFWLFLLLLLIGLAYGLWPFFSLYQIHTALKAEDETTLSRKVDWPALRASLRPRVEQEVKRALDKMAQTQGARGQMIRGQLAPMENDLVKTVLDTVVTPNGLIQAYTTGGQVSDMVSDLMGDQLGKLGELGALLSGKSGADGGASGFSLPGLSGDGLNDLLRGPAGDLLGKALGSKGDSDETEKATKAEEDDDEPPSYGLANLKRLAFTSPTRLELGVAKDPEKETPDLTAVMTFRNFDWKLSGLLFGF